MPAVESWAPAAPRGYVLVSPACPHIPPRPSPSAQLIAAVRGVASALYGSSVGDDLALSMMIAAQLGVFEPPVIALAMELEHAWLGLAIEWGGEEVGDCVMAVPDPYTAALFVVSRGFRVAVDARHVANREAMGWVAWLAEASGGDAVMVVEPRDGPDSAASKLRGSAVELVRVGSAGRWVRPVRSLGDALTRFAEAFSQPLDALLELADADVVTERFVRDLGLDVTLLEVFGLLDRLPGAVRASKKLRLAARLVKEGR